VTGATRALAAAFLALLAGLAGCGVGPGEELGGGAQLRVTRDFGHQLLGSAERAELREGQTVMRLLQSEREVETAYGGGFVESIDGLASEGSGGGRDWFYFVNGLEADVGAAEYRLSPGDVVQWDYRYWQAAMRIPAIVGAFPEPFLHGTEGERIPTRVECAESSPAACEEVKRRLSDAGVPATGAPLGAPAAGDVLRVVVGPWQVARGVRALQPLERGPEASGVFARFDSEGEELALLDERGQESEVAPPGTGLVAATERDGEQAVWAVTGLDEEGVQAAADSLDQDVLRDAFAVAASPDGPVRLPVVTEEAEEARE
jgi:hypothetical protein